MSAPIKSNPLTPVIFRRWPKSEGGEIIAIFPCNPGTNDPYTCDSYMYTGQHGSCDPVLVIQATNPAYVSDEDVLRLKRELENYGPPGAHYNLVVRSRHTQSDLMYRIDELNKWPIWGFNHEAYKTLWIFYRRRGRNIGKSV